MLVSVLVMFPFSSWGVAASNAGLTYQGVLTDSSEAPITTAQSITFKIYDSAGTCLMWSELQTVTPDSKGRFSVVLGLGSHTDSTTNTFKKVFTGGLPLGCDPSGTYTPSGGEDRLLSIVVGGTTLSPSVAIKSVPFAMQAEQVAGYGTINLAKISGVGSATTLTPYQYDFLANLAAPATSNATPCTSNDVLKLIGSTWTCTAAGGGGSASTSGLTSATASNTIDNANFAQAWNWSTANSQNAMSMSGNALTSGNLMSLSTTSALTSGSLLNLTSSNVTASTSSGLLSVINNASSTSGVVARIQSSSFAGSGLTVLATGNVGIGTTNPTSSLTVVGEVRASNAFYAAAPTGSVGIALDSGGNFGHIFSPASNIWSLGYGGNRTTAGSSVLTWNSSGNVGVGTTSPSARLDVAGQMRSANSSGNTQSNATTSVDWNNGNAQTMSASCDSTSFSNMLDGGTYLLAVTNTGATTCTFSHATPALTFYFSPANGPRTAGQRTVYTFQRIGTDVYVSWIAGFQ